MTNLPPELGRMIFDAIMNTPPPNPTKMKRECARAKRRLEQIVAEMDCNEIAAK